MQLEQLHGVSFVMRSASSLSSFGVEQHVADNVFHYLRGDDELLLVGLNAQVC